MPSLPRPSRPDALRPDEPTLLAAWAERVRADRAQVTRLREVDDPADYYAPVATRFMVDPRSQHDPVVSILESFAEPSDRWLDIGAGGGRYALPLALRAAGVIAVEPSPSMRSALVDAARAYAVTGIEVRDHRWPPPGWPDERSLDGSRADVALIAHVGYDIEAIGPFLDAMEAAASRSCVAVVAEGAMTTIASLLWAPVHGEPRVLLPALPELVALLIARGRMPEIRLTWRVSPTFETWDDLEATARRQLWVRPGSEADARLRDGLRAAARLEDGRWTVEPHPTRIGVVRWDPR